MIRAANSNNNCRDFFTNEEQALVSGTRFKRVLYQIWKRRRWLLLFLDANLIFLAFLAAYLLRFQTGLQDYFSIQENLDFEAYFMTAYVRTAIIFTVLWVGFMVQEGMYSHRLISANSPRSEIQMIFWSGAKALALLMALSFLFRGFLLSRFVYGASFVVSAFALISLRQMGRSLAPKLIQLGAPRRRTLVIGTNELAIKFASELEEHTDGSQEIIGFLAFSDEKFTEMEPMPGCKIIGQVDEISSVRTKIEFDRVMVSGADFLGPKQSYRAPLLMRILNYCEAHDIPLYLISFSTEVMISKSEMGSFNGVPLLLLRDLCQHPFYSGVKRLLDIVVSLVVLVPALPVWIIVAIAIKLDSTGPVLYFQDRVGLNGKPFKMMKFRSMIKNADESLKDLVDFSSLTEPVFNIRKDPRVTRIGAILRRTSMDEIPQFINVLKGDMSVIGPRPERTELVEMYDEYQWRRLKSKPGITGYQQVMSRGDPSLAKRIQYDLFYLKHQSLWLDLIITLKTAVVIARGDGVK